MNIINILLAIICGVYSEIIDRSTPGDTSDVLCTEFPCVINCLITTSCLRSTIQCPTEGSGDCTINLDGDSAAESSTINAGQSTNLIFNVNPGAYESLFNAKINANNINDLIITVNDANRALFAAEINVYAMTGKLQFNVNGNSYHAFHSGKLTVASGVDGNVEFIEDTTNPTSANFKVMELSIAENIGGYALFESRNDNNAQAFDVSTITIGTVSGDLTFLSNSFGSFSENKITINGDVNGNVLLKDTSTSGYGFCCSQQLLTITGNIGGNFQVLDQSQNGKAGYDAVFRVNGNIGGFVSVKDKSTGAGGGDSFHSAQWYLSYPNTDGSNPNTITGDVEFVEDSVRGESFDWSIYNLGNIGGNALFQSVNDVGRQSFDVSTFKIASIGGNLEFKCNSFGSFSENKVEVSGDIGGDVLLLDTSRHGHGFCCGANYWNFLGTISGSVSVRDETTGATGGRTAYDTNFKFVNVVGNMEFIENSPYGVSFGTSTYDIAQIGGNLKFESKVDNGRQAWDLSTFNIGTVNGDLSFLSNTFGCFSECRIYVDTVLGTSNFIGTASGGYDFYDTDIDITNCPNVIVQTNERNAIMHSAHYYRDGVGLVDITTNGGNDLLYATILDAQYADEIVLKCDGDSDCANVDIKCPENNRNNKCRIYCSSGANCNDIDLFTTNGYCLDASFNCLDNNCQNNVAAVTASQVFCITDSIYTYGQRGTYCQMNTNNNNKFYCNDIGAAKCDFEDVCGETVSPTKSPTKEPSQPPTKSPTKAPTKSPTFEPCTDNSESYNIQFILDESGSVNSGIGNENNYAQSIDFVINLIQNDINSNSQVSALAYSTVNDDIYAFTDPQNDGRNGIINALTVEKTNYAAQWTDTYNGLKRGIELFQNDYDITDNKIMILITDGIPKCGSGDNDCVADVCGSDIVNELSNNDIRVYIIGVGEFDSNILTCLVDDANNDIKLIDDFTSQEFKSIEEQFRTILCPNALPSGRNAVNIKKIMGNNFKNYNNDSNYGWMFVIINAMISVITTLFIILLCYGCYYYSYKYSKQNKAYSKVVVHDV